MFCENCGKENPAGVAFCEGCGSALEGAQGRNTGGNDKMKMIAILAGGVVVLLLVFSLIFGAFTPGSVKALKKMNKAELNGNAKAYYAVQWSPYTDEWEWDKDEKNEAIEEKEEKLKDEKTDRKEENIKESYKNYKVSKKYKKNEVNKIAKFMEEHAKWDIDEYKLQKVQIVKYSHVIKEDGDTDSNTQSKVMVKVKGKWYVDEDLTELGKDGIKALILDADND